MLWTNITLSTVNVNVFPLTSIKSSIPEEDLEGCTVTGSGAGGVHIWDVVLALDHVANHHASNFSHDLMTESKIRWEVKWDGKGIAQFKRKM